MLEHFASSIQTDMHPRSNPRLRPRRDSGMIGLVYTNYRHAKSKNMPAPLKPPSAAAGVPLYSQIAENLLDQIESGRLTPGDRLPPERDLSNQLGVNRLTLRRALRLLEGQGLLVRRQGAGTYIAQPKLERQAGQLVSFTKGMRRRGYKPGARVIQCRVRPAEASVARRLKIKVSAPVYDIHRLRLVNGQPVLLERYLIPVARCPGLDRQPLARRSMYAILEKEYGVTVARAQQSLEPVIATAYEAGLLGVAPGAALMLERRLSFDLRGRPVEFGKDLYRGDRFRFTTEMASLDL